MEEQNTLLKNGKNAPGCAQFSGNIFNMFPQTLQQESQSLSKNLKLRLQYLYQNGEVQVNHNRFPGYTKLLIIQNLKY